MRNRLTIAIYFCNAKKMKLCIDIYHRQSLWKKCLCNLLQLEPCNNMFKVISDIMAHSYEMWYIITAINYCIAIKMNCALIIIISNLNLWKKITVISDMLAHRYDMKNTIILAINFCNAKKMNCVVNVYRKQSLWHILC